jgi:anion-transporting  ArsA/GET3 family ATPase
MIDPGTIGLAIAGVRLVVNAVKSAADEAREAVDSIQECVDSGKKLGQSLSPVKKFFAAASKYESNRAQLEVAKKKQDEAIANGQPVDDPISDAEYVMDMMAADREIAQYYAQIKHVMIYHFDEAGMWEEFWERMNKVRQERAAKAEEARKAATEARLALVAEKMRKKRKLQKTLNIIYNCVGGFVITLIIAGFAWFIKWMFDQGAQ